MFVKRCESARNWRHDCSRLRWNVRQPSRKRSGELIKSATVLLQREVYNERDLHHEVQTTRWPRRRSTSKVPAVDVGTVSQPLPQLQELDCLPSDPMAGSESDDSTGSGVVTHRARSPPLLPDKMLILREPQYGNAVVRVLPLL